MTSALPRILLALAALPLLTACENNATAYSIDGSQHALILVREQRWLWDSSVEQAVVASRLPDCQRKVTIHPGPTVMEEMQVYEAGDRLWALHQGNRWYLAGTDRCLVQDWDNAGGEPPGPLVGRFQLRDGAPVFTREATPAAQ
ncbi:hypothetical protein GPA19_08330 [Azoarcus indigens]|uniref:Lipoprotein n=1 Tax=Azoarcus indigens TaxID=29545 RepID=A0A4R6DYQ8_9RHOO|nr:hypothetical protein [Azoarcus indigens]NMG64950.1 hypothetical protein [Azoarcus indigens]TDN50487.1 hypothetical protein C7389_109183 [Azoarcus indigens]